MAFKQRQQRQHMFAVCHLLYNYYVSEPSHSLCNSREQMLQAKQPYGHWDHVRVFMNKLFRHGIYRSDHMFHATPVFLIVCIIAMALCMQ